MFFLEFHYSRVEFQHCSDECAFLLRKNCLSQSIEPKLQYILNISTKCQKLCISKIKTQECLESGQLMSLRQPIKMQAILSFYLGLKKTIA